MKNTRTRKKCTSDEILEHIDIEADIERIKNKIPNILSSVQNGDTIVTKYSCNCCGKEDSIEKTIKTENHSHKIVTPTKCRYCNNTFEKNISNITTYWIWRTATINGIPRVVGSKYYIGKEIEHRGMVAFAEEGSVYGFDKGWYENFSPANTYNGLKSEWNETARRHLYLDNSEETLLEWYNTLELKTLFDVCAVYKENNSKATKRVDKRVTLYNELLKKLPPLPEVEFEKKTLPYAIYKEEGYDLCTHSTKISHTCPNCGTYTESSLNYVNRFQHCISCNEDYEIYKSETDALVQTQVEYRMVIDEAEHNGETYIVIRDISAIKKKRVEDSIKYVVHYSYVLSNSAPTFRVTSDNVAMVYHNGIHSYNPVIIRAESLRYSALKEYLGISDSNPGLKNIDRYIKEYQANPVLEQATKAGLSYEYLSCGVFDKNKTNLLDSLRLAKYFYTMFNKLCPLNTETLSRNMCVFTGLKYGIRTDSVLNLLQFLTRYDVNASIDDVKYCFVNGIGEYQLSKVYNIFPTITLKRIVEYLDRVEMYQCINPKAAIEEWGDYLYAAQKLKMDLTDNKVKYPGSLRKEHDVCTFKWQTIQKANKLECFKETSEEIEQRYAYSTKDFFITVPHSYEELFEEGRKLSHCVGNYGDRILNRETNIVFLRKKENPTEPFYTIEISTQNKIVQIKGHHNYVPSVAREPEMMEFIEIWKDKKKIG